MNATKLSNLKKRVYINPLSVLYVFEKTKSIFWIFVLHYLWLVSKIQQPATTIVSLITQSYITHFLRKLLLFSLNLRPLPSSSQLEWHENDWAGGVRQRRGALAVVGARHYCWPVVAVELPWVSGVYWPPGQKASSWTPWLLSWGFR